MKRVLLLCLLAAFLWAFSVQAQDEIEWVCPEGFEGQSLRIFNWADYLTENTVPRFEALCGVKVELFTYASNEEMVSILRSNAAQYDLVVPSGYAVEVMIQDELIQALDKSKIPNLANLAEAFTDPSYDPGGAYSVAYQWGTVGIAYNKEFVDEPITSWAEFFAYDGPVVWLDDQRAMLGTALLMLGYDPNSFDPDEINEAVDYLLAQNRNANGDTNVFEITFINGRNLMLRGDVDAAVGYSGDMLRLAVDCECDDYEYILPAEGTTIWTDNMAIPANALNPALVHAFIDYILDPVVGAELTDWVAYATPNAAARPLTDENARDDARIYPDDATLDTLFPTLYAGEAEQFYSEAWNRLLAEISQ